MQLGVFTEEAYDKLINSIEENTEKYSSSEDWLQEFFKNEEYCKKSSVAVDEFKPCYVPGPKTDPQKSKEDLDNTILMHKAFKNLNPQQASNKYLWAYLCHAVPEFRGIQDRWMQKIGDNTIITRFFVKGNGNLLNDNALSRLWWYGYLTYDESLKNPYELTEILFINQTICSDVMDTLNRNNLKRIKGVLYGINDYKDAIGTTKGISDDYRECKKYLNHYAAVTMFDFLDSEEIRKLTYDFLIQHHNKKKGKKVLKIKAVGM